MMQTKFAAGRKVVAAVVACVGVLLLLLPFVPPVDLPLVFLFAGRFHPLVLHFPIVLGLVALVTECIRYLFFRKTSVAITEWLLGLAVLSSWITVFAGYFLYASGEYSGDVIDRHFWSGAFAGAGLSAAFVLLMFQRITGRLYGAFIGVLLLTNGFIAYASHLGGTVTHGPDYLTEYWHLMKAKDDLNTTRTDDQLLLYADMVSPVLEARCVSCHNQQRAKGGLAMDGYARLFGAGDSNKPAIVAGSVVKSEAMSRIHLPLHDDEHMPPEGKSPLTTDEIALLTFWIGSGASDTARVANARGIDSIRQTLDRLAPELKKYELRRAATRSKDAAVAAALQQLQSTVGISVMRDSLQDEYRFVIRSMVPPHRITGESLREMAPYYPYFSRVSLPSSGIDDDLLYYLAQMTNVKNLYLQKNAIDGSGLIHLAKLPALEVLNISYTRLDDRHALDLLNFPALKKVYLFRTNVSGEVIKAIERYRPSLEILEEEGPY